jgi:hypothetical protein
MKAWRGLILSVCFVLGSVAASGQELAKPTISKITVLPSEPIIASGSCTASTAGYLEIKGRTKMTKAEIGKFVDSSLRDGYVITIYPETKRGIFVDMVDAGIADHLGEK